MDRTGRHHKISLSAWAEVDVSLNWMDSHPDVMMTSGCPDYREVRPDMSVCNALYPDPAHDPYDHDLAHPGPDLSYPSPFPYLAVPHHHLLHYMKDDNCQCCSSLICPDSCPTYHPYSSVPAGSPVEGWVVPSNSIRHHDELAILADRVLVYVARFVSAYPIHAMMAIP